MTAPAAATFPGLAYGVAMARRTTWRVGGPADRFFAPRSLDELRAFLASEEAVPPFFWLGHGSNLLVRDGGLAGTVICTRRGPKALERRDDFGIRAESGVASARVARFCAEAGLAGAAFLAGIPGSVGGAVAMNAGAYGGEVADILVGVELVDAEGRLRLAAPEELRLAYRHAEIPSGEWVVAAHFRLDPADPEVVWTRTRALLDQREDSQPVHQANAGSVFRNPKGDHAARLIEAAGLKGTAIGGAEVSPKHANFIVNHGSATAADIEALIGYVRERVAETSGVWLTPEVRIVGRPV